MHYRCILRILGLIQIFLACTMALPLFWALYFGTEDWQAFLFSIPLVAGIGWLLTRFRKGPVEIGLRDGFVIVTAGWMLSALMGSVPYLLAGTFASPVDAVFEAMSGLTTTGATVLTDIEAQLPGILFWRSFLHWLGGMGIIVIFLAMLPRLEGSSQLFRAEVPGVQVQRLKPRIRETAKILWYIYGALTILQTVLLWLAGMSLYDALIHTFGTMATGGFSSKAESIGAYSSPFIDGIIIFFMIAAGVNFSLYYRMFYMKEPKSLIRDPEFRVYFLILLGFTLVLFADLSRGLAPSLAFRYSLFQVVSIVTTTGYTTADFDLWSEFSRLLLFFLMFVGACAGSTGGSVKVIRFMILAKHIYREIYRLIHSNAILPLRHGDEAIPEKTIQQVMAFALAYGACFTLSSLIMVGLGLDLVSAVSSVAATLGNVGPGLAAVGPTMNYAFIPVPGKILLTFLMLVGRLEVFTVLVVLAPAFWRR